MSARQRMPCKSASMATDMTLETWRYRNQWLSTSIDVDTPWKTLRSWSLKNVGIMTFNSEEGGKDSGLTNSGVWHLRGWISPNVHAHRKIALLNMYIVCMDLNCFYKLTTSMFQSFLYLWWWSSWIWSAVHELNHHHHTSKICRSQWGSLASTCAW